MKVIYTENAKEELTSFHEHQQTMLEEVIKNRKYVFGDDAIEITASDIREASRYIQPINVERSRSNFLRRVVLQMYLIMGLLLAFIGLFYPFLKNTLYDNPTQVAFVLAGFVLAIMSVFMQFYFKYRDERRKQFLEFMIEEHKVSKKNES